MEIKHGDLFSHLKDPCILAHGCNAQGKQGAGFAKELRHRYPDNYFCFIREHSQEPFSPGDHLFVKVGNIHIANLITQRFYGRQPGIRYVDLDALRKCLFSVAEFQRKTNLPIMMPPIGLGLGGLEVSEFVKVYEDTLADCFGTIWCDSQSLFNKLKESLK
jgi:hypothetical protein